MAADSVGQSIKVEVDIVNASHWGIKYDTFSGDLVSANLASESTYRHLFAATARLHGKGECKAWLIKPELVDLKDYAVYGLGPADPEDLMHEVFDWPRTSMDRGIVNKGVKFLQQFDMDYDYLEEELEDIRDRAWIIYFCNVFVEEIHRRQGMGTALVRGLIQEVSRLAQPEGRVVLAFAKLATKSTREEEEEEEEEEAWGPRGPRGMSSEKRGEEIHQEPRIQASFWESLAFERLTDGQLFAKDLDWLTWSPKARNAALLFERPSVFPVDFDALIEGYLIAY